MITDKQGFTKVQFSTPGQKKNKLPNICKRNLTSSLVNENKSCMGDDKQECAWMFPQHSCSGQTKRRVVVWEFMVDKQSDKQKIFEIRVTQQQS